MSERRINIALAVIALWWLYVTLTQAQGQPPPPPKPWQIIRMLPNTCRVLDSRLTGQPLHAQETYSIPVSGICGIRPEPGDALVLNATLIPRKWPIGFLTLWTSGPVPVGSVTNSVDGGLRSNFSIVGMKDGNILAFIDQGEADLVIDALGVVEMLWSGSTECASGRRPSAFATICPATKEQK